MQAGLCPGHYKSSYSIRETDTFLIFIFHPQTSPKFLSLGKWSICLGIMKRIYIKIGGDERCQTKAEKTLR